MSALNVYLEVGSIETVTTQRRNAVRDDRDLVALPPALCSSHLLLGFPGHTT